MNRHIATVVTAFSLTLLAACDVAIRADEALLAPAVGARRCANCGWIESKREVVPATRERHAVRSYEYTVRMHDGSSSVFQQALPASWRLGERLTVIGGAALK
jgi:hypothetical protein